MNGGLGDHSYAQNSSYQGSSADLAKSIIEEEISKKLDIEKVLSTKADVFCVADFGCATGHNSFPAIQTIVTEVEKKCASADYDPDFHVLFNDQVMNDFNTLFNSLPVERTYHAAGVPGSFHTRLFPKNSVHFAYSAWALHWLSRVPKARLSSTTEPSWSKWKAYCKGTGSDSLVSGYSDQYALDMGSFLEFRAKEIVAGGLMAFLIAAVPDTVNPNTDIFANLAIHHLGTSLQAMANEGKISEEKLDAFNFPLYFPTPSELKGIIERCPGFAIERMEILTGNGKSSPEGAKAAALMMRAASEELLTSAFGSEIMDELFDKAASTASNLYSDHDDEKNIALVVVLSRK